jgi:threonine dehydrogenase-like Zn-dependent dehydrogenase
VRAVGLNYDEQRLESRDVQEPGEPGPGGVLLRIEAVGVCGTDRGLTGFHYGEPPEGSSFLTLGHEALATVVSTGELVVPTVRRGCGSCPPCGRRRNDLCVTGRYRERGIMRLDGYFREYAVDREEDLVRVPASLGDVAILTEPLSVVEKAIETAFRFREEPPRTALILGAGPVGLLAAMALQSRGLAVSVYSVEARDSERARLAERAGARYLTSLSGVTADVVIEATGALAGCFAAIGALGPLGVAAILSAPEGEGSVSFHRMVLGNQRVFGSVNANRDAFAAAVEDLARFDRALR